MLSGIGVSSQQKEDNDKNFTPPSCSGILPGSNADGDASSPFHSYINSLLGMFRPFSRSRRPYGKGRPKCMYIYISLSHQGNKGVRKKLTDASAKWGTEQFKFLLLRPKKRGWLHLFSSDGVFLSFSIMPIIPWRRTVFFFFFFFPEHWGFSSYRHAAFLIHRNSIF